MIAIGTKVYSFLDHPFRIVEGKILDHVKGNCFNYLCEFHDPKLNQSYFEHCFSVYLTPENAEAVYTRITELMHKS
jgi:hypothetical protein